MDFVAITLTGAAVKMPTVVAYESDMTTIRSAAEAYVRENEGASVTIYAKGQTVQIVCAPKWG